VRCVVDRVESGVAICECVSTGAVVEINVDDLPPGTKEGHVISKGADGYVYDEEFSKKRLADLTRRMNALFDKKAPE